MHESGAKLRIGRIDYTNVWPIFHYFPESRFGQELEIVPAVPSTLNRGLAEGSIDMGAISSFAYAKHYPDFVLLPDLCVSAYGKVGSIFLFHKKPLDQLTIDSTVALVTTSATSVNLFKILISRFIGGHPRYVSHPPDLDAMMEIADAALLIGDDAIRASWRQTEWHRTDLGEWWKQVTGQWMVFAVWAVRRQTVERYPDLVQQIYEALLESKRKGTIESTVLAQAAVKRVGGGEQFWLDYFAGLGYDFREPQMKGLSLYYQYAKEAGLLDREVTLDIWSPEHSL